MERCVGTVFRERPSHGCLWSWETAVTLGTPSPALTVRHNIWSCFSEIAQVIASYTATGPEQLTLAPGQLILIRKKNPGGWWEGELQVSVFVYVKISVQAQICKVSRNSISLQNTKSVIVWPCTCRGTPVSPVSGSQSGECIETSSCVLLEHRSSVSLGVI